MRWRKDKARRGAERGSRGRLLRALGKGDREERLAAVEALLGEPLSVEEVAALCPVLEDLGLGAGGEGEDDRAATADRRQDEDLAVRDLAVRVVEAFGRARWRRSLPTLLTLHGESHDESPLREAARQALDAIQPGLSDPNGQASDAPAELEPRTVVEKGLLTRGGMSALKDYLARMALCGAFATIEMPRTRGEEALQADRSHFGDRRLRGEPDFSGTLDETTQQIIEGLYAIAADLGRKTRGSGHSAIRPHTREGIPGLAEVRTQFGSAFAYVDLVARCDLDWFYYWGTERE